MDPTWKAYIIKVYRTLPEYDESKLEKVELDSEEAYDKFICYTFIQGTDHSRTDKLEEDFLSRCQQ